MGDQWVAGDNYLCSNITTIYNNCTGSANTSAGEALNATSGNQTNTTLQECGSNNTWAWAQQNQAIELYAYLQNNRPGVDELTRYC